MGEKGETLLAFDEWLEAIQQDAGSIPSYLRLQPRFIPRVLNETDTAESAYGRYLYGYEERSGRSVATHLDPRPSRPVAWIAAGLLAVAATPIEDYGFYSLLRFLVCGAALILTFNALMARHRSWLVLTIPLLVLWNPLIPIHLDKGIWIVLDLVAGALLVSAGMHIRPPLHTRSSDGSIETQVPWWKPALIVGAVAILLFAISQSVGISASNDSYDCVTVVDGRIPSCE